MHNYLDFEKPVADLEGKILELKRMLDTGGSVDVGDEIKRLEKRSSDALKDLYKKLTPWQKTQVARHPDRPHCLDFIAGLFTDFTPLAGDRKFAEDEAIQCGLARFRGSPVAVIGQEKGSDTKTRLNRMPMRCEPALSGSRLPTPTFPTWSARYPPALAMPD